MNLFAELGAPWFNWWDPSVCELLHDVCQTFPFMILCLCTHMVWCTCMY